MRKAFTLIDRVHPVNIILGIDLISDNEIQSPSSIAHTEAWNVMRGEGMDLLLGGEGDDRLWYTN